MGGAAPDRPQARSRLLTNPLNPALSRQGPEPLRLVVGGTDTDVGKTVVSALLVQGLGASYWKPVQCGLEGGGDRDRVGQWLQLPQSRLLPEAYRFASPVSPHWAAELEGAAAGATPEPIDPGRLALPAVAGPLVVECAGGLLVPLRRDRLQIEQIQAWGLPVVLVARTGLGTLNHTLLSLEALARRQIGVLGLVLNGPPHVDNPRTMAALGGVPVLACVPPLAALNRQSLAEQWQGSGLAEALAEAASALAPRAGADWGSNGRPGTALGSSPGPQPDRSPADPRSPFPNGAPATGRGPGPGSAPGDRPALPNP